MKNISKLSKLQTFTIERWERSAIKRAPYNPRKISKHALKKLTDNLERNGLVETLVVNRRTGNLVSGHQRLTVIDAVEGQENYSLDVAVMDLDDKKEKELNLILNNRSVAGEWDFESLGAILADVDSSFAGFDAAELSFLTTGDEISIPVNPEAQDSIDKIQEIKDNRKAYVEEKKSKDNADFTVVVVFRDMAEKEEFFKRLELKWDDSKEVKYINGSRIMTYVEDRTLLGAEQK